MVKNSMVLCVCEFPLLKGCECTIVTPSTMWTWVKSDMFAKYDTKSTRKKYLKLFNNNRFTIFLFLAQRYEHFPYPAIPFNRYLRKDPDNLNDLNVLRFRYSDVLDRTYSFHVQTPMWHVQYPDEPSLL